MHPLLKVAVSKKAKLITYKDALAKTHQTSDKYYKLYEETGDKKYQELYALTSDVGVVSLLNGYDGIIHSTQLRGINSDDQLINVLNRGVVTVSKEYDVW